ncbi:MAG TPA: hypothetical protein VKQ11_06995 [Candidatus Sulfotelmatobacter sp.]|nr:hypothetical protein [Candidatus Sulfotelmatobacter sp.]
MAKKKAAKIPPKLTDPEEDLLLHLKQGYQLETDLLGGEPVLRRVKDNEAIRPTSVNRSTVQALQDRGLIRSAKGRDPLTLTWSLNKKAT